VVRALPIARQRVAEHIPAATNTTVVRQRRSKHAFAAIEETVFSMGPSRDYISSPAVNEKSVVEREGEWNESSAVKEEGFGRRLIVSYCN
jgi:hypothetical protein